MINTCANAYSYDTDKLVAQDATQSNDKQNNDKQSDDKQNNNKQSNDKQKNDKQNNDKQSDDKQSNDAELNTVPGLLKTIRKRLTAVVANTGEVNAIMQLVDRLVEAPGHSGVKASDSR
jgi:alpha-galactosidase/6-phospho-beta-glucosidase family protein